MPSATHDLIVVGAGSGGISAALAAARAGLDVLLLEAAPTLGGTVVRAGVSVWEMGAGGTGLPFEIYRRMKAIPRAVGIYTIGRHCLWPEPGTPPYPGGESVIDPDRRYLDTLRRHGATSMAADEPFVRKHWHGVPFEPEAYARVVTHMLATADRNGGRCTVHCGTTFTEAVAEDGVVRALTLDDGATVTAGAYIDATGDATLARACGAKTVLGQEGKATYHEPDAPDAPTAHVNGVTLIYRVTPTRVPSIEPLDAGIPAACWWQARFPVASIVHYPNGDLNVNMLPTLDGQAARAMGPAAAYAEGRRRVRAHWHHLQTAFPEFQSYRMHWIAPALGVREGRRIVADYVLTEHDLLAGLSNQDHPDVIAIADHAMDTHGATTGRAGCGELREPYGIPYRVLIPQGFQNLLVACRSAGFSSLAASSCRLSRTMMQLGQAAGTAAALAHEEGVPLPAVPYNALRARLRAQHVQLDHPMPPDLRRYLADEEPLI